MQYLPIEGLAAFNKATAELLLGADNIAIKENRVSLLSVVSDASLHKERVQCRKVSVMVELPYFLSHCSQVL